MNFPKVAVLMAIFEPTETIIDQIKSIENQIGVDVTFYIGDDGTNSISLRKWQPYFPKNHKIFFFDRVGPGDNFLKLLYEAKHEEYFAFADQDDIWMEDKLSKHISILKGKEDLIAGSHSNSALLIGNHVKIKKTLCNKHELGQMITENCVQGCTLVINRKARNLIVSRLPKTTKWHDWWIGLILASVGKIYFVSGVDTLYRIHSNNTIGHPTLVKRLRNAVNKDPGVLIEQAKKLLYFFGDDMSQADRKNLENWVRIWDRNFFGRILSGFTDQIRRRMILAEIGRRVFSIFIKP